LYSRSGWFRDISQYNQYLDDNEIYLQKVLKIHV
jgi:hypothetical protein